MKTKNFKVLSIVLALVMALGLASVAVFADWPSFQNTNTNNGVITTAPPLDNPKTVLRVGLPTNDPYNPEWFSNSVWTGIDTTSVIKNGKAYTLYNGGVTPANNNTVGGARLGITDLATGAANSIQISAEASSGFQMSTPVIAGDDLYAAITKFVEFNANPAFDPANWTTPPTGLFFDGIVLGMYANSAGSVTTVTPDIYFPINMNTFTIELATSTSDGTDPIDYSIKLVDSGGLEHEIVPTMTAPAGM
ncbi:MAG TPA: hypothetical protein PLO47_00585, partial [Bacillota bacterium]|nr:hypothetical protein [Bacillota bacterium]